MLCSSSWSLVCTHAGAVLFLPQRPYMSLGTLREQLLYPNSKIQVDDTHLHEILVTVGQGFGTRSAWCNLGEVVG